MAAGDTRTLTVSLVAKSDAFMSGMRKARAEMGTFRAGAAGVAGGLKSVAGSMGLLVGAGGALAVLGREMAKGVSVAMEFESAFASVKKTVDASDAEFSRMREQLIEISRVSGETATSLFDTAGAAGQLGIAKENIVEFTRAMTEMGIASDLTSEQAAVGFAKWANATQLNQSKISNLSSAVVALGNTTGATESEILDMGRRFASTAKSAGFLDAEIAAIAASLVETGIEAEAGGSSIIRIIDEIQRAISKNGKELELWSALAGKSTEEFRDSFKNNAAQTFLEVAKGFDDYVTAGNDAVKVTDTLGLEGVNTSIAMRNLAQNIMGAKENIKLANDAFEQNIARTKEAEERYKTARVKIDAMWQSLAGLRDEMWNGLLPALGAVASGFNTLFESMRKMGEGVPRVKSAFGNLTKQNKAWLKAMGKEIPETEKKAPFTDMEGLRGVADSFLDQITEGSRASSVAGVLGTEKTAVGRLFDKIGSGWENLKSGAKDFWDSSTDYAMEFGKELGKIWDENFNWEKDPKRQKEFFDSIAEAFRDPEFWGIKEKTEATKEEKSLQSDITDENKKQQEIMKDMERERRKDTGQFTAVRSMAEVVTVGSVTPGPTTFQTMAARFATENNNRMTGADTSGGSPYADNGGDRSILQGILMASQTTAQNTARAMVPVAG